MSGMLGGLFGAVAGNWMYNNFFGGHSSMGGGSAWARGRRAAPAELPALTRTPAIPVTAATMATPALAPEPAVKMPAPVTTAATGAAVAVVIPAPTRAAAAAIGAAAAAVTPAAAVIGAAVAVGTSGAAVEVISAEVAGAEAIGEADDSRDSLRSSRGLRDLSIKMACLLCDKLDHLEKLPDEDIVWQFPHSVAFLGPWQFYTGYCVLVARAHAVELHDLPLDGRRAFLDEMCLLAEAIANAFTPRKLNYEALGNQVAHLHWHLFPRRQDDPEALKAVWLALERADHDDAEKLRLQAGSLPRPALTARLRANLHELVKRR